MSGTLLRYCLAVFCLFMFMSSVLEGNAVARLPNYSSDLSQIQKMIYVLRHTLEAYRDESSLSGPLLPKPEPEAAYFLQSEIRYRLKSYWFSVCDTYVALDRLDQSLAQLADLGEGAENKRIFFLRRSIFLTQYRMALELIPALERYRAVPVILNETDEQLGLQAQLYDEFKYQYLNLIKAGRFTAQEAVARYYGESPDEQLAAWADEDCGLILKSGQGEGPRLTLKNGLEILKQTGSKAWFPVQKGVANWMGNTKVWRLDRPLIKAEQIADMRTLLEPGDILLERREWYMTNLGIPGFWTHAAIYIGTPEQRAAFSGVPDVAGWLADQSVSSIDELIGKRYPDVAPRLSQPYVDGKSPEVIESIAAGVSLTSLEHSAGCDSIAILRPRLSAADRAAAVVSAMRYQGRPYDYAFDFNSDASLVCTELVVKAYLDSPEKRGLKLPLQNHLGHLITPANVLAKQFDEQFGKAEQQFDLVQFIDGNELQGNSETATIEVFRDSWKRPKWHVLLVRKNLASGGN